MSSRILRPSGCVFVWRPRLARQSRCHKHFLPHAGTPSDAMDQFQHAAGCVDRIDSESYSAVVLYCERCGDLESALPKSRGRKPKKPRAPTKGAPKQLIAHNAPKRELPIPVQTEQEPSISPQTAQREPSIPRQTLL